MRIFLSVLTLILSFNYAQACEIKTYSTILKIERLDHNIIKETNCNDQVLFNFIDKINSLDGVVSASQIKTLLGENVSITPKVIRAKNLSSEIKGKLDLAFTTKISHVKTIPQQIPAILSDNNNYKIRCLGDCQGKDFTKIQLSFNNQAHWISAKIKDQKKVFILNRDVNIHNTSLNSNLVRQALSVVEENQEYFSDINHLHFYKPNKRINKNSPLKINDLTPINLTHSGNKIKVILKSKTLTVKSSGVARQSGKFKQFIQIYNPITQKKYTGKLIDFNTAIVEL